MPNSFTKCIAIFVFLWLGVAGAESDLINKSVAHYSKGEYSESYKILKPLAEGGHNEAQYLVGEAYWYGKGVLEDKRKAAEWYKKSAIQGNAAAQNALGLAYQFGEGVLQDYKKAYYWYKKSADQNDPYGLMNVGELLLDGFGVQKNRSLAAQYIRRAYDHPDLKSTSREMLGRIWSREELWKY